MFSIPPFPQWECPLQLLCFASWLSIGRLTVTACDQPHLDTMERAELSQRSWTFKLDAAGCLPWWGSAFYIWEERLVFGGQQGDCGGDCHFPPKTFLYSQKIIVRMWLLRWGPYFPAPLPPECLLLKFSLVECEQKCLVQLLPRLLREDICAWTALTLSCCFLLATTKQPWKPYVEMKSWTSTCVLTWVRN